MPSILYIDATRNELAGNDAVEAYLAFAADPSRARLMSSLKSFLTFERFKYTDTAWGDRYTMKDLVAVILRHLKRVNDRQLGADVARVVIGHPVLFVGADGPDWERLQQRALDILDAAAREAGFREVAFYDEPSAALMGEELESGLAVAVDFGGGTFDVSVIEFAPDQAEVLALHGAAIGGELFDSLLFDAKIGPALGLDRRYEIDGQDKPVPAPLRRMRTLHEIVAMISDRNVQRGFDLMRSVSGQPLAMAEEIIFGGHGYNFFRAIERGKIAVSDAPETTISFSRPRISLSETLTRNEFESLIKANLDRVGDQIDRALVDANVNASDIDLVIRTGGSSRIPAFVQGLADRFGPDKLAERDAFSTVALGLGIRACQVWS
jgi:hypothetical chaperone protein